MPNDSEPIPAGPPESLLAAIRRLLGPLVRLLLEHQVTYPILANLLKTAYVDEATRHLSIPEKPQTISRLSLLTGIHRKDVKRLQVEASEPTAPDAQISLGAQLVLRWTAEALYRGADGKPMALPRLASENRGASFESLVRSVSKDIRPRAILDEWLRLGVVTLDAEDRVELVHDAFVPTKGFDEKAYFLGRNLRDHIASAGHNISGRERPMLERNVYYAGLRPESIEELETLAETEGMKSLQQVNRRARELQLADAGRPAARQRMSFGIYFHRAELDPIDAATNEEGESDAG